MAVLDMDNMNENMVNCSKLLGLVKAKKAGVMIPEFIYLSEDEYDYFIKYNRIYDDSLTKIKEFINKVEASYAPSLFSIRCETKANPNIPKTPPSLLNVGLISKLYLAGEDLSDLNAVHAKEMKGYWDRAQRYLSNINDIPRFHSKMDEIEWWLRMIYQRIHPASAHYVIIMRMVDGCMNEVSGAGICCDLPEDCDERNKYFRGVYIPYTQGIPLVSGCWGEGEVNIEELKAVNPMAYEGLKHVYNVLMHAYGNHPYFEYAIEGEKVYVLQYEQRRRFVVAGR